MTSPAAPPHEIAVDTPLSPRVVLLWRAPWLLLTTLLVLVTGIVAAAAADLPTGLRILAPVAVLAVGVTAAILVPNAAYRRWRYAVTDDGVELRHGLVLRHESSIPHFRVQHIDIEHGPIDRWRGLVKLTISTASPASDAVLPGIEPDRAEDLRARILARAEADDGV